MPKFNYIYILFIPYLLFCFFLVNDHLDWGDDYAGFILQAKYYYSGDYSFQDKLNFISSKSSEKYFPPQYPPVYSFFLSIFFRLGINNFFFLKFVNVIIYLFFLIVTYLFLRQHFNKNKACWIVFFLSINPIIIKNHINLILSDICYLFFSTTSIYLMINLLQKKIIKNYTIHALFVLLFIILSIFTKITGISLILTFILCLLLHYKKKFFSLKYFYFIIFFIFITTVIIFLNKSFLFYFNSFFNTLLKQNYLNSLLDNFYYHFFLFEQFFGGGRYAKFIFDFSLIFVLIGVLNNYKLFFPCIIFSIIYFIIVIIQITQQGERYLLPIFPFYIFFFYLGLNYFNKFFIKNFIRLNFFFLIVVFIFSKSFIFSYREFNNYLNSSYTHVLEKEISPNTQSAKQMFQFVIANIGLEEVIVYRKPRALSLFTNRYSFMSDDLNFLINSKYHYLVLDKYNLDYQIKYEDLDKFSLKHSIIFENKNFVILKKN
jgi:hypothetical protein